MHLCYVIRGVCSICNWRESFDWKTSWDLDWSLSVLGNLGELGKAVCHKVVSMNMMLSQSTDILLHLKYLYIHLKLPVVKLSFYYPFVGCFYLFSTSLCYSLFSYFTFLCAFWKHLQKTLWDLKIPQILFCWLLLPVPSRLETVTQKQK